MKKFFAVLLVGIVVFCVIRQRYEALLQRKYRERKDALIKRPLLRKVRVARDLMNDLQLLDDKPSAAIYNWIGIECSALVGKRLFVLEHGRYSVADFGGWLPSAKHIYFCVGNSDAVLCSGDRLLRIVGRFSEPLLLFALDVRPRLYYAKTGQYYRP